MSAKDRKCLHFRTCKNVIYRDNATGLCRPCFDALITGQPKSASPRETVQQDLVKRRVEAEITVLRAGYKEALKTIERQGHLLSMDGVLKAGLDSYRIVPKEGHGTSEGTVIAVASDWHVEEKIGGEVGHLNLFNLDIAHARATKFFQSLLRLVNLLKQDIAINTLVLALLGDFISNDIHEEFADLTDLQPMHAIVTAQNMLISGIDFLLEHLPGVTLVIPCHSGNHARTTKTTRFSAENGHSLEYLMYLHLQTHYRSDKRVQFIIPAGYHSYVQVYDQTIRFHHGHALRYAGGVGGLFIPTYKAIDQWNTGRHADLDVFGHFHQMRDGGRFIANGSLIGYSGFALSIKAPFEPPRQTLFLIDKKRGRTCTWPILLS